MRNFRVAHLSDLLNAVHAPLWVKTTTGTREVERIRGATEPHEPDITLLARDRSVIGEFPDQRVKLCLDTFRMAAHDVQGEVRVLSFGDCQPNG